MKVPCPSCGKAYRTPIFTRTPDEWIIEFPFLTVSWRRDCKSWTNRKLQTGLEIIIHGSEIDEFLHYKKEKVFRFFWSERMPLS